jgi:protein O-GlcNAc transferase
MTIPQAFQIAVQRQQEGRLAEADALYRQILVAQPNHAESLHSLGVIALQTGRLDAAVAWIRKAIAVNPASLHFYLNLSSALVAQGGLDEAIAACRHAIQVKPDYPEAHNKLGNALRERGQFEEAIAAYRRALQLNPDYAHACNNLGSALRDQGRLDESIESYRRAIQLAPDFPAANNNLGNALRDRGKLDEAIVVYRRALELKPDFPEAHNNLGNALWETGHPVEAIVAYRRALELKSDFPEAHANLGNALRETDQPVEAIAAYRRALELRPNYPKPWNDLGNALRDRGQLDEAIAAFRRGIEFKPDFPKARTNLGNALKERGQLDEAIAEYRHAIEIKPDLPEAHSNLGNALRERGQLDEAIAVCRRALELKPDFPDAHNNLGIALSEKGRLDEAIVAFRMALQLKPQYPEALNNLGNAFKNRGELEDAIGAFRQALQLKPDYAAASSNLVFTFHFHPGHNDRTRSEERLRWQRQIGDPMKRLFRPHANDGSPDRRLRVGYVSPDFWDHVVGRNLIPLFECHDRRDFEVLCYAGVMRPDPLTERFRQRAHKWRSTVGVPDEALAEMIRRDGVDILVDLSQHTAGNRLPMFARKPAPVQVSFAGYPESTGLEAIEYRISDRYLEAGRSEEGTAGKEHICLIDSFWCYDPCGEEAQVNELPATESGRVTFGCLNNFCKVNEGVLRLWARVLGKVTGSRLILLSGVGSHRQGTLDLLEREGIEAHRVEFVEFQPRREYLELYHRLDMVLDTFPYNGHTTSLDALWMGVPVVSMAGDMRVSRAGLSQLTNLGLPELVARSEEGYVGIAVELAGNLQRLAKLRSTLRGRMEHSVLMDAPHFARQVEQAYRKMWQAWRAEQSRIRE